MPLQHFQDGISREKQTLKVMQIGIECELMLLIRHKREFIDDKSIKACLLMAAATEM